MPKVRVGEDSAKSGGGDPNILKLGDTTRLRVVDPVGIEFKQHVVEDTEDPNNVEFLVCPGSTNCPLCRKPVTVNEEGKQVRLWPISRRFGYNVWDYDSDSVKVLITGPQVNDEFKANKQLGYDPVDWDFRIVKMGKGKGTKYKVARGEKDPLPKPIEPDMLHDLDKYDKPASVERIFEAIEKAGYDYDAIVIPTFTEEQALAFTMPFGRHSGMTVEQILANDPEWAEWLHDAKLSDGGIGDPVFIALQTAMEARGMVPALDEQLPSAAVDSTTVARDDDPPAPGGTSTRNAEAEASDPEPEDNGMAKLVSPTGDEVEVPQAAVQGLLDAGFTKPEDPTPVSEPEPEVPIITDTDTIEVTMSGAPVTMMAAAVKAAADAGAVVDSDDPSIRAYLGLEDPGAEAVANEEDAANDELEGLSKPELQAKAKELGHKVSGTKPDLIARIRSGQAESAPAEAATPAPASNGGSVDRDALLEEVKNLLNDGEWSDYKKLLAMLHEVAGKNNISDFSDDELVKLRDHLTSN